MKNFIVLCSILFISATSFAQAVPEKKIESATSNKTTPNSTVDKTKSVDKNESPTTGGFYVKNIDQPKPQAATPASKNKNNFLPKPGSEKSSGLEEKSKNNSPKKENTKPKEK